MPAARDLVLGGLLVAGALPGQAGSGYIPGDAHLLAVPGVRGGVHYFADWSGVWKGGVRNRDTWRSLTDLHFELESEPLVGWAGATLFIDAYRQVGRDGSLDSGDIQVYSNLDGPNRAQIAELWAEQRLLGERLRLKVGKVDANEEFAALPHAGEFIHSSAGFSPTIVGFPSYPDPAMSVNLFVATPAEDGGVAFYGGLGVYDGATLDGVPTGDRGPSTFFRDHRSDAFFLIAEGGARWREGGRGAGSAAVGVWHHTARLARFDGGVEDGTSGFYGVFGQRVSGGRTDPADPRGAYVMASFGWADDAVSPIAWHHAVGARYVGLLPGRGRDSAGLFVSHVRTADHPNAGTLQDETAFELYYRAQIGRYLFVQPVLQYIRQPAFTRSAEALIGTVRFELKL